MKEDERGRFRSASAAHAMQNPHLKDVLANFPDVQAGSLPWPDGAETWTAQEMT